MYIIIGLIIVYILARALSSILIFPGQIFASPEQLGHLQTEHSDLTISFAQEKTHQNRSLHTGKTRHSF